MATYHCSVKVGAKGKAGPHAAYISREGKYQDVRSNEKLEHVESGNMPPWAKNDPAQFWPAADQHERANGATYREIEIALPRELNEEQRLALVRDFVTEEIGNHHAYTFAIHAPQAAIAGGEQPHAHIMYSERTRDDIERDPEQYFKRYNAQHPEKGGCRKDSAGTEERLQATRQRWGSIQNAHLARYGHDARVDHRSLKQQGIDRTPEPHLGAARISRMERIGGDEVAAILEKRRAEGAKERADADLKTSIIDLSGDLAAARAERDKIISQEKEKQDAYRTAAFNRVDAACRATVRSSGATNRAGAFVESDLGGLAQEHRAIDTANGRVSQAIAERGLSRNAGKALDAVGIVLERACSTLARTSAHLEARVTERQAAETKRLQQVNAAPMLLKNGAWMSPQQAINMRELQVIAERQAASAAAKQSKPLSRYHPESIAKAAVEAAAALAAEAKAKAAARAQAEARTQAFNDQVQARKSAAAAQKAIATIEKKIDADGLSQEQRAIVMAHVRENIAKAAQSPAPAQAEPDYCTASDRAIIGAMHKAIEGGDKKALRDAYGNLDSTNSTVQRQVAFEARYQGPFLPDRARDEIQRELVRTIQGQMDDEAKKSGELFPWGERQRIQDTYQGAQESVAEKIMWHQRSQRPEGFFKKKEGATWDAELAALQQRKAGWEIEIERRDAELIQRVKEAEPATVEKLAQKRQEHANREVEYQRQVGRSKQLQAVVQAVHEKLEKTLGKDYQKELTRSRGMER